MSERMILDGLGVNTDINFCGNQQEVLYPEAVSDQIQSNPAVEKNKHQTPPQVRGAWESTYES